MTLRPDLIQCWVFRVAAPVSPEDTRRTASVSRSS